MPVTFDFSRIPQVTTAGTMADQAVNDMRLSERVRRYMTSHSNFIPSNVTVRVEIEYSALFGGSFYRFEATMRRNGILASLRGQRREESRSFRISREGMEAYMDTINDFEPYLRQLVDFERPEVNVPVPQRNTNLLSNARSLFSPWTTTSNSLSVRERQGPSIISENAIAHMPAFTTSSHTHTANTTVDSGRITTGTLTVGSIDPISINLAPITGSITSSIGYFTDLREAPGPDPYSSRRQLYECFSLNGCKKNCTTCYHYDRVKIFDPTDGTFTLRPMCTIKDIDVNNTCLCENHRTEDLFICWRKS